MNSRNEDQQNGNSKNEIYVGNFNYRYTEEDMQNIFQKYNVVRIRIHTKEKKAFAFVEFASHEEASNAIAEFSNCEIEGRKLLVRLSRSREVPSQTNRPSKFGESSTSQSSKSSDEYQNSKAPPQECPPPLEPMYNDYDDMPPLEPLPSSCHSDVTDMAMAKQDTYPLYKIALSNFPNGTTKEEICKIFQRFSPVMCNIITAYRCGPEHLTSAHIYFLTSAQALDAVEAFNLLDFRGQLLEAKYVGKQLDT